MSGQLEAGIAKRIWAVMAQVRCTLFRTNSGKAWLSGGGPARRLEDGSVLVPHARPVGLGMALVNGDTAPGLSDYNGWTVKTIRPEWVGRRVAVFTGIETKRAKNGRATSDQENWVRQVRAAGGIGVIANSPELAVEHIEAWEPPLPGEQKIPQQLRL